MAGTGTYFHVGGLQSGVVKSGGGLLQRVIINKAFNAAHLTLVDSTDPNSTAFIAEDIEVSDLRTLEFQCQFMNGLSFKFGAQHGFDITIVYE